MPHKVSDAGAGVGVRTEVGAAVGPDLGLSQGRQGNVFLLAVDFNQGGIEVLAVLK